MAVVARDTVGVLLQTVDDTQARVLGVMEDGVSSVGQAWTDSKAALDAVLAHTHRAVALALLEQRQAVQGLLRNHALDTHHVPPSLLTPDLPRAQSQALALSVPATSTSARKRVHFDREPGTPPTAHRTTPDASTYASLATVADGTDWTTPRHQGTQGGHRMYTPARSDGSTGTTDPAARSAPDSAASRSTCTGDLAWRLEVLHAARFKLMSRLQAIALEDASSMIPHAAAADSLRADILALNATIQALESGYSVLSRATTPARTCDTPVRGIMRGTPSTVSLHTPVRVRGDAAAADTPSDSDVSTLTAVALSAPGHHTPDSEAGLFAERCATVQDARAATTTTPPKATAAQLTAAAATVALSSAATPAAVLSSGAVATVAGGETWDESALEISEALSFADVSHFAATPQRAGSRAQWRTHLQFLSPDARAFMSPDSSMVSSVMSVGQPLATPGATARRMLRPPTAPRAPAGVADTADSHAPSDSTRALPSATALSQAAAGALVCGAPAAHGSVAGASIDEHNTATSSLLARFHGVSDEADSEQAVSSASASVDVVRGDVHAPAASALDESFERLLARINRNAHAQEEPRVGEAPPSLQRSDASAAVLVRGRRGTPSESNAEYRDVTGAPMALSASPVALRSFDAAAHTNPVHSRTPQSLSAAANDMNSCSDGSANISTSRVAELVATAVAAVNESVSPDAHISTARLCELLDSIGCSDVWELEADVTHAAHDASAAPLQCEDAAHAATTSPSIKNHSLVLHSQSLLDASANVVTAATKSTPSPLTQRHAEGVQAHEGSPGAPLLSAATHIEPAVGKFDVLPQPCESAPVLRVDAEASRVRPGDGTLPATTSPLPHLEDDAHASPFQLSPSSPHVADAQSAPPVLPPASAEATGTEFSDSMRAFETKPLNERARTPDAAVSLPTTDVSPPALSVGEEQMVAQYSSRADPSVLSAAHVPDTCTAIAPPRVEASNVLTSTPRHEDAEPVDVHAHSASCLASSALEASLLRAEAAVTALRDFADALDLSLSANSSRLCIESSMAHSSSAPVTGTQQPARAGVSGSVGSVSAVSDDSSHLSGALSPVSSPDMSAMAGPSSSDYFMLSSATALMQEGAVRGRVASDAGSALLEVERSCSPIALAAAEAAARVVATPSCLRRTAVCVQAEVGALSTTQRITRPASPAQGSTETCARAGASVDVSSPTSFFYTSACDNSGSSTMSNVLYSRSQHGEPSARCSSEPGAAAARTVQNASSACADCFQRTRNEDEPALSCAPLPLTDSALASSTMEASVVADPTFDGVVRQLFMDTSSANMSTAAAPVPTQPRTSSTSVAESTYAASEFVQPVAEASALPGARAAPPLLPPMPTAAAPTTTTTQPMDCHRSIDASRAASPAVATPRTTEPAAVPPVVSLPLPSAVDMPARPLVTRQLLLTHTYNTYRARTAAASPTPSLRTTTAAQCELQLSSPPLASTVASPAAPSARAGREQCLLHTPTPATATASSPRSAPTSSAHSVRVTSAERPSAVARVLSAARAMLSEYDETRPLEVPTPPPATAAAVRPLPSPTPAARMPAILKVLPAHMEGEGGVVDDAARPAAYLPALYSPPPTSARSPRASTRIPAPRQLPAVCSPRKHQSVLHTVSPPGSPGGTREGTNRAATPPRPASTRVATASPRAHSTKTSPRTPTDYAAAAAFGADFDVSCISLNMSSDSSAPTSPRSASKPPFVRPSPDRAAAMAKTAQAAAKRQAKVDARLHKKRGKPGASSPAAAAAPPVSAPASTSSGRSVHGRVAGPRHVLSPVAAVAQGQHASLANAAAIAIARRVVAGMTAAVPYAPGAPSPLPTFAPLVVAQPNARHTSRSEAAHARAASPRRLDPLPLVALPAPAPHADAARQEQPASQAARTSLSVTTEQAVPHDDVTLHTAVHTSPSGTPVRARTGTSPPASDVRSAGIAGTSSTRRRVAAMVSPNPRRQLTFGEL